MRRLALTCVALLALAAPATAAALRLAPGDGTLVVRGADNGDGTGKGARPVVTLVVDGFAIGHIANEGRIAIYDLNPTDQGTPEVTGATWHQDVTTATGVTGTMWAGTGPSFYFRAVGGTYKIVIWGSGVYVFAGGQGRVWLTGQTSGYDGQYSLNGGDFRSLPYDTARPFPIAAPATG